MCLRGHEVNVLYQQSNMFEFNGAGPQQISYCFKGFHETPICT